MVHIVHEWVKWPGSKICNALRDNIFYQALYRSHLLFKLLSGRRVLSLCNSTCIEVKAFLALNRGYITIYSASTVRRRWYIWTEWNEALMRSWPIGECYSIQGHLPKVKTIDSLWDKQFDLVNLLLFQGFTRPLLRSWFVVLLPSSPFSFFFYLFSFSLSFRGCLLFCNIVLCFSQVIIGTVWNNFIFLWGIHKLQALLFSGSPHFLRN